MSCELAVFGRVPPRHARCFRFKPNNDCSACCWCAFEHRYVVVVRDERSVVSLENREETLFIHAVLVGIVNGEVGDEVHG